MPLLVRGLPRSVAPLPSLAEAAAPGPPLVNHIADRAKLSWIDPSNQVWDLGSFDARTDATRFFAMNGVKGLGAAPLTFTTDAMPRGGAKVRHIQPQPRLVTLPIMVEARDNASFMKLWRGLAQAFTATRRLGPGRLRVTYPDASAREILAYYQDGWDVSDTHDSYWDTVALTLYCEDPYWRDVKADVQTFKAPTPLDYQAPLPQVTSSQSLGDVKAINLGGVEAWPSWAITGPADVITATNTSTGEGFTLDVVAYRGLGLQPGETITITTDPPTVRGPDGSNWIGALNWPDCTLFRLDPGTNHVHLEADNVETPFAMTMTYYPRYETA